MPPLPHTFSQLLCSPLRTQIFLSVSYSPYFNLSLEHYLFTTQPTTTRTLLLYTNTPCVVLGRNQNPWKEIAHSRILSSPDVELVRRRSGGGTVFHDLGNTNYSVALPTREFTRDKHAQMIARALCAAGVDGAAVNGRHDVIITPQPSMTISDDGVLVRKVSGSAYKITRERSYHHGTMLLSTDLSRVSALLRSPAAAYITARGVASVPSPVTNINLDRSVFINAVVAEFLELYALKENEEAGICYVDDSMTRNQEALWKGFEELKSPEWIYGQTPKFILRLPGNGGVLEVDKGHVTAASMIPEEVVGMKFGGAVVRRCMIASGTGEEDAIKWQNDIIGGSEWGSP